MKLRIFDNSHPGTDNPLPRKATKKMITTAKKQNVFFSIFKLDKRIKANQQFFIGSNLDTK